MKKFIALFITLLCVTSLQAKTAALQPLTIVLDWFVNPQHAPIIIAQELGYFKQQGLKVNIVAPADPSDPPKLVAAGKADIAIGYQPELYLQVQGGLPLVRIGTLINTPLRAVVVLKSSSIHSLSDFKGATIGYSMSGVGTAILNTMLANHGVDPKSVNYVDVHYNLVQALLSKRVDAISGIGRNFEVPEMEQTSHEVRTFYPEDNGVPTFDALIFLANRNNVNDPKLLKFLTAINQALDYMQSHPLKSWQLLIKGHPELNNKLNQTAWQITTPDFADNVITLDTKQYENFAQWMLTNKLITKVLPLSDYAVQLQNTDNDPAKVSR
jgi:putative hydroxymethylpyrimidine transport system substrate-binding protein